MGKYTPKVITIESKVPFYDMKNIKDIINGIGPLSGFEPVYNPNEWNLNENIKMNHNCYSYAFNDKHPRRKGKAQPGYYANYPPISEKEYNCNDIYKRIKRDNPSVRISKFHKKCPKGAYKAFFALDTEGDTDYHFYRQDKNGYWSHKPGRTNVVNIDASNKLIKNPKTANRNYGTYNYNKPCNFFCLRPDMTKTHSKSSFNKY